MVTVRPGRPSDLSRLSTIQQVALPEYSEDLLRSGVSGSIGLLVAEDASPVGYTLFLGGGDTAVVLELAVEPDRQDEHIGSTLLEETCAHLESTGHDTIRLTARESDERVRKFYRRHGFVRQDQFPGFFETDDGVLLVKQL